MTTRKSHRVLIIVLLVVMIIFLEGCQTAGSQPKPRVVRIGHTPTLISGLPIAYVAQSGLLDDPDYQITWQESDSPPTLAQAFAARDLDIAVNIGLTTIFSMVDQGVPLRLISIDGYSSTGGIYSKKVTSVGELKGLKVSLLPKSQQTTSVTIALLAKYYGLNVEAGNQVMYQPNAANFALLMKGDVDAAQLMANQAVTAKNQGYTEIFNMNEEWKRVMEGDSIPIAGNIVRPEFLSDNGPFVRKFVEAHNNAVQYLQQHPEELRKLAVKLMKLTEADTPGVVEESLAQMKGAGASPQIFAGVNKLLKFSVETGLAKTIPEDMLWNP